MDSLLAGYLILGLLFALFAFVTGENEKSLLGFFGRLIWVVLFTLFWLPLFLAALIIVIKENRE